ncbi:MAG: S53 family peptidase [Fimbriimonas ginsengisoli]|uniref:S53 family peptidase n=1 Tax=Fimbriimonas ginsengisoli TaxID=1005039 RepID=A0A931LVL6_FIMGI|nr:S53 family peptidase [Fimbriimonas ginsengisoli]MBI3721333.1 S53 family peptidase [Fimbriimonas ginsengisoli]
MAAALAIVMVGCGGNGAMVGGDGSRSISDATAQNGHIVTPDSTLPQGAGFMHTNHLVWASNFGPMATTSPTGKTPAQMRGAYSITANGSGAIAIVDAYNFSTALNDFNVFSTQFGLPTEPSTDATLSSNTVLQVVYASGSKPRNNAGWALEEALDIEWAHAMAPNAKIYLVEAASNSFANLVAAENVAKALVGVHQVSNSWSGGESSTIYTDNDSVFVQSGVAFYGSGGDTGGVTGWPALSSNVVAVGGTTLNTSGNTWVSETVWGGSGCGSSAYEPRPAFQDIVSSLVGSFRGADDISADADPNTGASVYDTAGYQGQKGWFQVGGTSLSCPVIAGIANAAGSTKSSQGQNTSFYAAYAGGSANFHDIKSGTAGSFSALTGWDFPTGVGSPNGTGGF